MHTNDTVIGSW